MDEPHLPSLAHRVVVAEEALGRHAVDQRLLHILHNAGRVIREKSLGRDGAFRIRHHEYLIRMLVIGALEGDGARAILLFGVLAHDIASQVRNGEVEYVDGEVEYVVGVFDKLTDRIGLGIVPLDVEIGEAALPALSR